MARRPFDPSLARGGLFDAADTPASGGDAPRPLSVTQAAELLKGTVGALGRVRIEGEVGTLSSTRHCYFALRDEQAVVSCVMWSSALARSAVKPQLGVRVQAEGVFDYYGPGGRLNFVVDRLKLVGEGDLDARFRALCAELRELGYFDEARKRTLPAVPRGVAIVTAAGSAALADCVKTSAMRLPGVPLVVVSVAVQGADAPGQVARAIELVNAHADRLGVDVLLVTRGGGSREDLQAFNERVVADAAFRSRLPLVAAIGHESDTSVIELVADLRSSTPTQAIMAILPDRQELGAQVDATGSRLSLLVRQQVVARRRHVQAIGSRACLRDGRGLLKPSADVLARVSLRLRHAVALRPREARLSLGAVSARLDRFAPSQAVAHGRERLRSLARRLSLTATHALRGRLERAAGVEARLESVSPEQALARGYSITLDQHGRPVRDAATVPAGSLLVTRLQHGELRSRTEAPR